MDTVTFEECAICSFIYNKEKKNAIGKIAKKRALRTAHELATKEAEKPDSRLSFIELYGIFFKKIYEHEYERHYRMEQETQLHEGYYTATNPPQTCGWHDDLDPLLIKRSYKKTKREFSDSKWKPTTETLLG